jgi:RHH-type proline utilization regulon transcriptional repressor/proline dehydrogenase/delta 1-pyrroline-5-carboxylate dehydrogenase
VLHVVRYNRNELDKLVEQINASGYGLTLGVHTRIDETIAQVTGSAKVGNLYVNRNMVGAVVGVQPFGGEGLSGTGPKAGGPLYLYRLLSSRPQDAVGVTFARQDAERPLDAQLKTLLEKPLQALQQWAAGRPELQALCQQYSEQAQSGTQRLLPGPTGERNTLTLMPRERVLCVADNEQDALIQLAAVLAVGCEVLWPDSALQRDLAKAAAGGQRAHSLCQSGAVTWPGLRRGYLPRRFRPAARAVRAGGGARRGDCLRAGLRPRRNQCCWSACISSAR